MSLSAVFADAFLDGFTMAGFGSRLRRPGQAVRMFDTDSEMVSVPVEEKRHSTADRLIEGWIQETYGIRTVPEAELNAMLVVLKRQAAERDLASLAPEGEPHGAAR